MNTRFAAKTLFLTAALTFVDGAGLALRAAEKGKDKNKDKAELRAPLVVVSEAKAPNRDRADRLSYSAVIKKISPSVVAVIVNRKERAAPAASGTPSLEELLQRGFPGMPGQGPGQGRGPNPNSNSNPNSNPGQGRRRGRNKRRGGSGAGGGGGAGGGAGAGGGGGQSGTP